jgi:hypothetical protein
MKSTLKVGPIKKADVSNAAYETIRKQIKMMKVGDLFEVSGSSKKSITNVRQAISYYSKKDNCPVSTQLSGNTLIVEKTRKSTRTSLINDSKK